MTTQKFRDLPLIDLRSQHDAIRDELREAFERVLDSSAFSSGPEVEAFEADLAAAIGVEHVIGVASGTAALHLTLLAAGIGAGDQVILPTNSFFATAEAVLHTGAEPVLVDVLDDTANIDAAAAAAAITPKTAAIVPVHLYGQPADMDAVDRLAARHGLFVLEDACQALGASWQERAAGALAGAGAFSFYAGKNLGALGEAGAISTNDGEIAQRVRSLRAHGERTRYVHQDIGFNERMDGLQAAFLAVKLRHLAAWQRRRDELAARYDELVAEIPGVRRIRTHPSASSVHHLYVVRVPERDRVLTALRDRGVGAAVHYPIPIHLLPAVEGRIRARSLPVAENLAGEILTLPLHPAMSEDDVDWCVGMLATTVEAVS